MMGIDASILIGLGLAVLVGGLGTSAFIFSKLRKKRKTEPVAGDQQVLPQPTSAKLRSVGPQATEPVPVARALAKTRESLFGKIQSLFGGSQTLSDDEREALEEILYTADLGPQTVQDLLEHVFSALKVSGQTGFEAVRNELAREIKNIFAKVPSGQSAAGPAIIHGANKLGGLERLKIWDHKPSVLLVVGVNGAGKTTTIGKMAARIAGEGKRVLVAAGDTFRAAAGEQLKIWTTRAAVEIFDPENVTEPSAVAYQALEKGRSQKFDVVIIDTAGRLHTQKNLMEELKKMKRVLAKLDESAPHEVLLVLDANSGQNALIQAKEFHGALGVNGIVLTKLDGSAKGGVAIGIVHEVGVPIKLIGVGEKIEDLRPFQADEFVASILGSPVIDSGV